MIQSEIVRGDELMLFRYFSEDDEMASLGGATNHTLTITPEYTEINCKDAGKWGWKKQSKVSWEITTDSLYTDSYSELFDALINDKEIKVAFGRAFLSNINSNKVDDGLGDDADDYYFLHPNQHYTYYQGTAKVSSLSLNAQCGDNATYSATFTGVGKLEEVKGTM